MASAKQGYPVVSRLLARKAPTGLLPTALLSHLNAELRAVVHTVDRLTPNIVEVVVKAPMAARAFHPGQFYRLQNFETLAPQAGGTTLAMEGLALTGAKVDREQGLLSTIVLEMGGSSDLCALLKPGEPVILMGPTGTPTRNAREGNCFIDRRRTGQRGAIFNRPGIAGGKRIALKTIYFAGYKKIIDRYKVEEIEKAADVGIWCCDEAPGFTQGGCKDKAFVGESVVEAILAYGRGDLDDEISPDKAEIPLHSVDRLVVIGSDAMMGAVARARHTVLAPFLKPDHKAIGSINLTDAMHDEGNLRAVLAAAQGSGYGRGDGGLFYASNQDQSLDAGRLIQFAGRGAVAKWRAGEVDEAVDRPVMRLKQIGARELAAIT